MKKINKDSADKELINNKGRRYFLPELKESLYHGE